MTDFVHYLLLHRQRADQPARARLRGCFKDVVRAGLLVMAMWLIPSTRVTAQSVPESIDPAAAFARYVPQSARVFISIGRLRDFNNALERTHAWLLWPLLTGDTSGRAKPFDLRQSIAELIGSTTAIPIDELMRAQVGAIAPSIDKLSGAVWFVRMPDIDALDRWFPPENRKGDRKIGAGRYIAMDNGLIVCVRDRVIAMARGFGSGALLRDAMRLMVNDKGRSLTTSREYRELVTHLPARALAMAYFSLDSGQSSSAGTSLFLPTIERAVVGMYEGDGRIDFAVRAALAKMHKKPELSEQAVERLMRLPQTTLFAWGTTFDFSTALNASKDGASQTNFSRYLSILDAFRTRGSAEPEPFPNLGPHVLVAWEHDFEERGLTPQVAVLVECDDVPAARNAIAKTIKGLLGMLLLVDPAEVGEAPVIEQAVRLGIPISYISLSSYAAKSRWPLMQLLGNVELAWSGWGSWLVVALSREHVERILDAQHGLLPTLAGVPDVQASLPPRSEWAVMSMVQANLASDMLERWLESLAKGEPSLLNSSWWEAAARLRGDPGLPRGYEVEPQEGAGVVEVVAVAPDLPGGGVLRVGDLIIAVQGQVLDLQAPYANLKRRWNRASKKEMLMLRVRRGETMLDIAIPADPRVALTKPLRLDPQAAIRELAALGRSLRFASFAVQAPKRDRYSALLSLRFEPDKRGETSSH